MPEGAGRVRLPSQALPPAEIGTAHTGEHL